MKNIMPKTLTRAVGRQVLKGRKNAPTLLFAAGIVGVVATAVVASRATLKLEGITGPAHDDLELIRISDESDKQKAHDRAVVYYRATADTVRLYAPTVVVGGLTIAALTGSHNIMTSRNAGLAAAYTATQKAFDEYRKHVVDEYGEEKDREFRFDMEPYEVMEETRNGPKKTKKVGPTKASQYARFFTEENNNYQNEPEYNVFFLQMQQKRLTDRLRASGHLFLNEVYDELGLERSAEGQLVGWNVDRGADYVDFGIFAPDSKDRFDKFVLGHEGQILLDFNVCGLMYDTIEKA